MYYTDVGGYIPSSQASCSNSVIDCSHCVADSLSVCPQEKPGDLHWLNYDNYDKISANTP